MVRRIRPTQVSLDKINTNTQKQLPWGQRDKKKPWQNKQGAAVINIAVSNENYQARPKKQGWLDNRQQRDSSASPAIYQGVSAGPRKEQWQNKKNTRSTAYQQANRRQRYRPWCAKNHNKLYINTSTPREITGLAPRSHLSFQSVAALIKKRTKKCPTWLVYRVKKVLRLNARATRKTQVIKKIEFKNTDDWLQSLTYKELLKAANGLLGMLGRKLKTKNRAWIIAGLKTISAAYVGFKKGLKKAKCSQQQRSRISNLRLLPPSIFLNEVFRARVQTVLSLISKAGQPKRIPTSKEGRTMPGRRRPINKSVTKKHNCVEKAATGFTKSILNEKRCWENENLTWK